MIRGEVLAEILGVTLGGVNKDGGFVAPARVANMPRGMFTRAQHALAHVPRSGLLGGYRSYVILGAPLLEALPPAEFEAILAHEFGHLAGEDRRFTVWIHSMRGSWGRILVQMETSPSRPGRPIWMTRTPLWPIGSRRWVSIRRRFPQRRPWSVPPPRCSRVRSAKPGGVRSASAGSPPASTGGASSTPRRSGPGDFRSRRMLGDLLLGRDDESGLEHLSAVVAAEPAMAVDSCQLAYEWLFRRGRREEADEWFERRCRCVEAFERGRVERLSISASDDFLPHGLPEEIVAPIRGTALALEGVCGVWLVRKRLIVVPDETLWVLFVDPRRNRIPFGRDSRDRKILFQAATAFPPLNPSLKALLTRELAPLRPRLEAIESARLR